MFSPPGIFMFVNRKVVYQSEIRRQNTKVWCIIIVDKRFSVYVLGLELDMDQWSKDAYASYLLSVKKKGKLMIIVVSALSYPRYCLSTDQLVYRRATQTAETNIANET